MYYTTSLTNVQDLVVEQVSINDWLDTIYTGTDLPQQTHSVPHAHSEQFYRAYTRAIEVPKATLFPQEVRSINAAMETLCNKINSQQPNTLGYHIFHIPKSSGGLRKISAPIDELKVLQYDLVEIIKKLRIYPHDTAYAYVPHRCCKDALIEHQRNESKWFLKLDLKKFFDSCTPAFVNQQLNMLNNINQTDLNKEVLFMLLDKLAYLDGGLPQGTPISPMLTNLIMIPIDFEIAKYMHNKSERNFVYTRYADDILISSKYDFKFTDIVEVISNIFKQFNAPFTINTDKTRYGSAAGSNWNLGLMLNKDNNITLGHRENKILKASINNFLKDFTSQNRWCIIDTQILLGKVSYAASINMEYTKFLISRLEQKYNLNFKDCCKTILA